MLLGELLLPSLLYGILAGLVLTVLLIARTRGEEAMLGRELEGYREYTQNVRYRLFPFLW
jgi:protein-S-isoprenylcysteine O-methyltransferase Ste14